MMDFWAIMKSDQIKEKMSMKRILIIFISFFLLLGCEKNNEISVGDSMKNVNKNDKYISLNSLSVFKTDNIYTVIIEQKGIVQKIVKFSYDRKSHNVQGLTLVKNKDINRYMNMSLNELKEILGEVHTDIGSGFYIPTYITEDGYLICFYLENETVIGVIKRDILNNIIVEQVET